MSGEDQGETRATALVACATAHGSTRGVPERIAGRLRDRGIGATLQDVGDPADVASFNAAIIGSAIHNAHWLPQASDLLRRNREALASRALWLFSVSSVGDEESFFPPRVARFMRRSRKSVEETTGIPAELPFREHRNFAGVIERDHYPLVGNLFMKAMHGRYGDHRSSTAIDAWADEIAGELTAPHQRYSI